MKKKTDELLKYLILSVCLSAGSVFFYGCAGAETRGGGSETISGEARERAPAQSAEGVSVPPSEKTVAEAAEADKKYIVLIADWGKNPPGDDIASVLESNPKIILTVPWPYGVQPSTPVANMVVNMQLEPVLSLSDEPILPMVCETIISTSPLVEFSWPQDIASIIFKNQEDFRANFHLTNLGLYLRTGVLSKEAMAVLKKQGVMWANAATGDENKWGFYDDDFMVLVPHVSDFADAKSFFDWIIARDQKFNIVIFKGKNELRADFLLDFAALLGQKPEYSMLTPEDLLGDKKRFVPQQGDWTTVYDYGPWLRSPSVWYKLSAARNAVEDYKNSGSAKLEILDKLKNELYFLYRYDFLEKVQESQDSDEYRLFQASLNNIYSFMEKKESDVLGDFAQGYQPQADTSTFHIDITENSLSFFNSVFLDAKAGLREFSVELTKDSVIYSVELDSNSAQSGTAVDVYMDLNSTPGAGLTRLLPDVDAFMKQQDAWEFALRIENGQAGLYTATRFAPNIVKKFTVRGRYVTEIPRSVLRGNPLKWSYQVVTLARDDKTGKYEISDFLFKDELTRSRMLENKPVQLNAFRASKK